MNNHLTEKLVIILTALIMIAATIFHCGAASAKELKIAMVLWRGETEAEKGFKEELRQMGYRARYTVFDAQQNKGRLNSILREQLDPLKFDYVYTFGTTVSLQTKTLLQGKVPQIFNVVSYPVRSGLVSNMSGSKTNIGGVKSDVPLRQQILNAMSVTSFRRLGVVFNPREKNSNLTVDELMILGKELGFEIVPLRSPPVQNRLARNILILQEDFTGIDTVFLPADSFITSQAGFISTELAKVGIRTIGASHKLLSEGILLGSVIDYATMGRQAAYIVEMNQLGTNIGEIPVAVPQPKMVVNRKTMDKFQLQLKSPLLSTAYID